MPQMRAKDSGSLELILIALKMEEGKPVRPKPKSCPAQAESYPRPDPFRSFDG